MDMDLAQRMLDVVAQIPAGRVATYGDVAARAGSVSPRLAGFVLSQLADDATPAAHLAAEQISRLRAENVEVIDGRVDLKTFRWRD
jgi:methylated-DNA-protein-cysteine methyltransferase related protein